MVDGFEAWWCKWLEHARLRHGVMPNDMVQTQQLERLVRAGPAKAVKDLQFSIEKNAKSLLDSDNDYDKKQASLAFQNETVAQRSARLSKARAS